MSVSPAHSAGDGFHALVFGASGLAGSGVVNQLLSNYPSPGAFKKVTALSNRPFDVSKSFWPEPAHDRPELVNVSGVNLSQGSVVDFRNSLEAKIADISTVTHVYYFAFKSETNLEDEMKSNKGMFDRVVGALDTLCPALHFFVFPGGSRRNGVTTGKLQFPTPLTDCNPRLENPEALGIWYYYFEDVLTAMNKSKGWKWAEVCPDAIIGYTPAGSAMNLTSHWANYLSVYANEEGKGSEIAYPGTVGSYRVLFNEVSTEMLGKMSIWASLHPDISHGEIFNVADQKKAESMEQRWPALAEYFGLKGVGPSTDGHFQMPSEYINKHKEALLQKGIKLGDVFKDSALDTYGLMEFDRHFDLSKAEGAGFTEKKDPNQSWFDAFDKFKKAGLIPS